MRIAVISGTHEEYIGWYQGVLLVNPGSVTYPGLPHSKGGLGTLAYLDIRGGVVSAEIHKLQRSPPRGDA
jgi:predicted phosphodiesterase